VNLEGISSKNLGEDVSAWQYYYIYLMILSYKNSLACLQLSLVFWGTLNFEEINFFRAGIS